jgi:tRNA threonylcarbamoyladenosine biosynthesis protein TsaB
MQVLGFDTATDQTAVAATRDGEVVFASAVDPASNGRPAHATRLLAEVEKAAAAAGGWSSVDRIVVGTGPGSFTGLRIGIATARALALAQGLELVGAGTLEGLARGALPQAGRPVLAALDARRGELFSALFGPEGEQRWAPAVDAPDALADRISQLAEAPLAVGSGALRFRDELDKQGAEIPVDDDPSHRISAVEICAIGARANGRAAVPEPLYLRRPDAERWRERDGKHN